MYTALVQASVEHLKDAERSWERFVKDGQHKIKGYPSVKLERSVQAGGSGSRSGVT